MNRKSNNLFYAAVSLVGETRLGNMKARNFSEIAKAGCTLADLTDLLYEGHLEKFFSPSRFESDSLTARSHGRMEQAGHGAEGLFRC